MIQLDEAGRTFGHRRVLAPPRALAGALEYVWLERRTAAASANSRAWRIVPDRSGHLLLKLSANGSVSLRAVGARSRYADVEMNSRNATFGLRFHPGALEATIGIHGRDLADRGANLKDILPRSAARLLERVHECREDGARVQCLLGLLAERRVAVPDWRIRSMHRLATRRGGDLSVRSLGLRLGVPARTLREVCVRATGLTPKRSLRIARLHAALSRGIHEGVTWRESAFASGYADQAHLIRESRALLGETPQQFASRNRRSRRSVQSLLC